MIRIINPIRKTKKPPIKKRFKFLVKNSTSLFKIILEKFLINHIKQGIVIERRIRVIETIANGLVKFIDVLLFAIEELDFFI